MSKCSYNHTTGLGGLEKVRSNPAQPLPTPRNLSKRLECVHCRLDLVVLGLVAGGWRDLAISDDALAIDDNHGAARNPLQAAHVRVDHVELLDGVLVEVAQQVEVEGVLAGELLQREWRVHADAEHRRVDRIE